MSIAVLLRKWIQLSVFSALGLLLGLGRSVLAQEVIGQHPGYLMDVEQERQLRVVEMVLIPRPQATSSQSLNHLIFNANLSREFQLQYDQRFGRSDAEKNIRAPGQYEGYEYSNGVTLSVAEYQQKKREFGEYMVRRLSEHHVDQFFKSSPKMRHVYEFKERVSNVKMEVKRGYRVRLHYSFSANYLDIDVENPYEIDSKVTLMMDPVSFGPSRVQNTIIYLAYPFEDHLLSTQYVGDGSVSVTGTRYLTPGLSVSLTGFSGWSTHTDEREMNVRESLILVGLTWSK